MCGYGMTKMKREIIGSKRDRLTSISHTLKNSDADSEDEIQMTLAPYIQSYLAHSASGGGCGCLPVPFERAAPHSWIRPCFDSDILENQFKINSFRQFTKRFRYALIYIMTVSAAWLIYLVCKLDPNSVKYEFFIFTQMFLIGSWILGLTYRDIYRRHNSIIAGTTAVHLVATSLIFAFSGGTSTVSHFTMLCYVILVIYTIVPLPPYVSLIICVFFSIFFEIIIWMVQYKITSFQFGVIVRVLCHICVHIVGFHILVMTHVRVRGTFMKVGQRLLVRRQLEMEKQLKEKMIHSVMPPKVAAWLLSGENGENNSIARTPNHPDFKSLFRPFNMSRMDNVSILFADIVGFTKMSSNKTAEEIVDILNDLFQRFDDLCSMNGCEKISTLGDCYYCVSGCPEPRPDHAKCCVEMGLGMIDAIQEFDVEKKEDVNMRVGVHTGTVLCGVVGTRRFKFDVWSNDVSFANKLESTGVPGRVHISEQTAKFLQGLYALEDYEDLQGVKTYLIEVKTQISSREIRMATPLIVENLPPVHFKPLSISHRKRLHSYNSPTKKPHYLSLITESSRSKYASLPNVLSSNTGLADEVSKSGTSKWFSISRLKKESSKINISVSEVASSLNPINDHHSSETHSLNKSSMCRLDIPQRQEGKSEEEMSLCPSVNSRKDSGIRSTSRRSSIQQQIYLMNGLAQGELLTHRVSGYYTSSQSSLTKTESEYEYDDGKIPNTENLVHSLRKQSDLQLIRCVNDISQNSYIVKVPLHPLTLFFKDKKTEKEYRANAHKIHEKRGDSPATLSTSRFNTYFDILVSAIVLICTTASLYILYVPSPYFVAVSVTALLIQSTALFLCLVHVTKTNSSKLNETTKNFTKKIVTLFSKWYPWHVFGGILVSLPILVILTNFTYHSVTSYESSSTRLKNYTFDFLNGDEMKKLTENVELRDDYYTLLVLIGLVHFCNFTQLNFFMKSILALINGVIYLVIINNSDCQLHNKSYISGVFVGKFLKENFVNNETGREIFSCCDEVISSMNHSDAQNFYNAGVGFLNAFYNFSDVKKIYVTDIGYDFLINLNKSLYGFEEKGKWLNEVFSNLNSILYYDTAESILNVLIILLLVILLNREFEISYRLSYFCNTESNKDKMKVQNMKDQADWLLENIIPKHVSRELKSRAKYCENHTNVGIIFASIVNFNKLYDESYSGGKEYLRVLNELISDFDELLDEFKNVDKIKTIGSTFMAASGLNPELRKQNKSEYEHIFDLMEFAKKMYKVVDVFNRDLLGFNLILRIGFNIGEVTAGVIGSSKLFYDIWGDAVNVASRMDSTGVDGKIQVPFSSLAILSQKYDFEPRGFVYVKGKGDILVYLLKE